MTTKPLDIHEEPIAKPAGRWASPTPLRSMISQRIPHTPMAVPNHSELASLNPEPPRQLSLDFLKSRAILATFSAVAALIGFSSVSLYAQNYSIDWHTIDGGGGASAGGNFSLSGTIGQPDATAQPMSGGAFSLTGGFWSLFVVQTAEAPLLTLRVISASATQVSWPSPSAGFILQQNSDLNSTNWVKTPQTVTDNGTSKFITVTPATDNRFYRLFKP